MRIKIEGVDFAICNPVGPINVKLSLMMRKFSVDTFFRGKEISKGGLMERPKQGIFGNSVTQGSLIRGSRLTQGYGGAYSGEKYRTINGEQIFNLLTYRKLNFDLDFDTQIDLNDNIVNILTIDANTGSFLVQISTILTKKIQSLQKTLVPEKDPQREMRQQRRAQRMKLNFAKAANTFVKGSGLKHLLENGEKFERKCKVFQNLNDEDLEQVLLNSKI